MQGTADLYDGLTPRRHRVTVVLSRPDQALKIEGASLAEPLLWPLQDLRALHDHADAGQLVLTRHDPSQLDSLHDPARLVIEDAQMIDWLRTTRPRLMRRDLRAGTGRRIAMGVAGALGAVALMIFVILPALAGTLARLIPLEKEIAFGRSVTAQMERLLGAQDAGALDCNAPQGRAALDKMLTRLTEGQTLDHPLTLRVIDHGMVNAFAAPGGQIVIMRGLLDEAGTPEMVAAVLAHEIGHVAHRDPTRNALRAAGSVGLLGLVFGDFTGGAVMVLLADRLINARYSQQAEAAADSFAHRMLRDAGLPPSALGEMFETFQRLSDRDESALSHFASHPDLAGRIAAARQAPTDDSSARPVLSDREWRALRGICNK